MRKTLFFTGLAILLASCSLTQESPKKEKMACPLSFYEGDALITVNDISSTRADGSEVYSLCCEVGENVYETIAEINHETSNLSFVNHCTVNGDAFATLVFYNDELVSVDLVSEDEVSTRGNRKPGEKFNDCCVRTYKDIRDGIGARNPALCEFEPKICVLASVVVSAAGCITVQDDENTEREGYNNSDNETDVV